MTKHHATITAAFAAATLTPAIASAFAPPGHWTVAVACALTAADPTGSVSRSALRLALVERGRAWSNICRTVTLTVQLLVATAIYLHPGTQLTDTAGTTIAIHIIVYLICSNASHKQVSSRHRFETGRWLGLAAAAATGLATAIADGPAAAAAKFPSDATRWRTLLDPDRRRDPQPPL